MGGDLILFDATVICQAAQSNLARTGVWKVVQGLWRALEEIRLTNPRLEMLQPFSLDPDRDVYARRDPAGAGRVISLYPFRSHASTRAWNQQQLAAYVRQWPGRVIVVAPYGPLGDFSALIGDGAIFIHYIHDLIPILQPALASDYSRQVISQKFAGIQSADIVLVNSADTAAGFRHLWANGRDGQRQPLQFIVEPGLGGGAGQGHGDSACTTAMVGELASEGHLLCIATIEPRKNVLRLLQAFAELNRDAANPHSRQLLLVGAYGWISEQDKLQIEELVACSGGAIRQLGYLPDGMVYRLIQSAQAVIQVSLHEGYGLVVREARAHGILCICSDVASLRDSSSPLDLYVNPESVQAIKDALRVALYSDYQREVRYSRSWSDVAVELGQILASI